MSDSFLGRWSRRKRAAQIAPEPPATPETELPLPELPPPELPPVDTLGPASDYTAFLQQGVSAAIQQQALRRAWETDAEIAGFRGMADYDWDFNAPGYGGLRAGDDVAKLVRNVLASPPTPEPDPAPDPAPVPPVAVQSPVPEPSPAPISAVADASEEPPSLDPHPAVRRHGSALPC